MMKSVLRGVLLVFGFTLSAPAFAEKPAPPSALKDYVFAKDDSFAWKLTDTKEVNGSTVYTIALTSQTWHDIVWEHDLQVYVPKNAKPQSTMLLWNQGGKASPNNAGLGLLIAEQVGAPIAFLFGVPKQPLYEGKTEDALIAETFVRYLESKDATWPLLFPMVKSVVRAMDALQAFSKETLKQDVEKFIITGASKRGWTSWLTAASGDPRVKAIAPLVIDTLNFPVQMQNQLKAFGKPSEMIRDYTTRKLVPIPEGDDGKALWQMVDPWIYADKITVPKMIINGTNDPYWPQDALNTYWDDLNGEKRVLYVPNAGHDLREMDTEMKKALIPTRAVGTLAAFGHAMIFDKDMPKLEWKITSSTNTEYALSTMGKVKAVRQWSAASTTRDFRQSRWMTVEVPVDGDSYKLAFDKPSSGFKACLCEVEFEGPNGQPCYLSTQIQILEAK
jgi:PhoPQ-activated pathogenicity-related protein